MQVTVYFAQLLSVSNSQLPANFTEYLTYLEIVFKHLAETKRKANDEIINRLKNCRRQRYIEIQ